MISVESRSFRPRILTDTAASLFTLCDWFTLDLSPKNLIPPVFIQQKIIIAAPTSPITPQMMIIQVIKLLSDDISLESGAKIVVTRLVVASAVENKKDTGSIVVTKFVVETISPVEMEEEGMYEFGFSVGERLEVTSSVVEKGYSVGKSEFEAGTSEVDIIGSTVGIALKKEVGKSVNPKVVKIGCIVGFKEVKM